MSYLLYIIFPFFSESNDIINLHTILLAKYEIRIQRQSNKHDIALLYWCRWYRLPRVNVPDSDIKTQEYVDQLLNNMNTHFHIK